MLILSFCKASSKTKMEESLPIDIHYNKLLDWLQNRRHCSSAWQQQGFAIRQKINAAIQDMPPVKEITDLLRGTYINYFHCRTIVELLKQTEDGSKNIFGRYSSQRLKDWLEIIKLYEKDGIYLAEAGQMLARSVNYEIPVLKRQITKCIQQQQDFCKKEVEYAKMSEELKEKFRISCKQMGVEGKNIKKELLQLVKNLPQTFDEIARETRQLSSAIDYYQGFIAFLLNKPEPDSEIDCLQLVRHVIEKGNTTVYEWQTGRSPMRIVELHSNLELLENEENDEEKIDEIDWGNIDFGASLTEGVVVGAGATVNVENMDLADAEIDWEVIDPIASGIDIEVVSSDDSPQDECVASGVETLSILDHIATRNIFVNELLELETFLRQRLQEMRGSGIGILSDMIIQSAPKYLGLNHEQLTVMLDDVQKLLAIFTDQKMANLLLIRSFPKYVDRLFENLKKVTSESEKLMSMSHLMVQKQEEALTEQRETEPKLETMRQKTKELQKQIEAEISIRYKNRHVNIMGEINLI